MRPGLTHLGEFAGHNWYKADEFGDNTKERYLGYMGILQQIDKFGLKLSDIREFVNATIKLSSEGKDRDVHTYLHLLNSYIELEETNDRVFDLVSFYILIDDEEMDKMTLKHRDLKKKLYKENTEIQLFFCEIYNILMNKPESYISGFKTWDYIRSRTVLITEQAFLRAINRESLL